MNIPGRFRTASWAAGWVPELPGSGLKERQADLRSTEPPRICCVDGGFGVGIFNGKVYQKGLKDLEAQGGNGQRTTVYVHIESQLKTIILSHNLLL